MQAVILAAGKGSRLDGIAAPYHKPLLVVNGKSLIVSAVQRATHATSKPPIVVVAPENALPIAQVLNGTWFKMIVQTRPTGPGDALLTGLDLVTDDDALVLMGDNVFVHDDVINVATAPAGKIAVGVQELPLEAIERFTRIRERDELCHWVEKVPPNDEDVVNLEESTGLAWVGPLRLPTGATRSELETLERNEDGERPLGPVLSFLSGRLEDFELVPVSTYDIGIPEALK